MTALTSTTESGTHRFEGVVANVADIGQQAERVPSKTLTLDAATIKGIRATTGLSQPKFARLINVDVGTLRSWEQGRRGPTGSAQALLKAIKHDPQSVMRALVA